MRSIFLPFPLWSRTIDCNDRPTLPFLDLHRRFLSGLGPPYPLLWLVTGLRHPNTQRMLGDGSPFFGSLRESILAWRTLVFLPYPRLFCELTVETLPLISHLPSRPSPPPPYDEVAILYARRREAEDFPAFLSKSPPPSGCILPCLRLAAFRYKAFAWSFCLTMIDSAQKLPRDYSDFTPPLLYQPLRYSPPENRPRRRLSCIFGAQKIHPMLRPRVHFSPKNFAVFHAS